MAFLVWRFWNRIDAYTSFICIIALFDNSEKGVIKMVQKKTLALAIAMILLTSMFLTILPIPLTRANPSRSLENAEKQLLSMAHTRLET